MDHQFKPYIPAEKIIPELTATSVVMGVILAVVFGAANAYLGLRVGMTISASIPAAVISMGIIRVIMKRDSILESNMVQTIGSAGESLAAGSIFTLPALFLWAQEGIIEQPSLVTITLLALVGGVLGVLFMVPLRHALIVKEHGVLPYPEGSACADVLRAGEGGGVKARSVFIGVGSLPIAIGLYLPLELSSTLLIGGLLRLVMERRAAVSPDGSTSQNSDAGAGVLYCSGMIAGEGLVGILLAVFAVLGIDRVIDLSGVLATGTLGSLLLIIVIGISIVWFGRESAET